MRHLNSIDFLRSLTRKPQLFFLCTPLLISACSLFEINEQSQIMNSLGEIRGEVDVAIVSDAPVHIALFIMDEGVLDLVDHYPVGDDGDGVVSLESQIPVELQVEAEKIYGFNSGHASILQDEIFITRFNAILEETFNKNASSR